MESHQTKSPQHRVRKELWGRISIERHFKNGWRERARIIIAHSYHFLSGGGGEANSAHPSPHPGVSRVQTGFLIGRFVFIPMRKTASKTFKEKKNDAFCLKSHDFLWHKHLI